MHTSLFWINIFIDVLQDMLTMSCSLLLPAVRKKSSQEEAARLQSPPPLSGYLPRLDKDQAVTKHQQRF